MRLLVIQPPICINTHSIERIAIRTIPSLCMLVWVILSGATETRHCPLPSYPKNTSSMMAIMYWKNTRNRGHTLRKNPNMPAMRPSFSFENSLGSCRLQPKKIVRRHIKQVKANSVEYRPTNTWAVFVSFNDNTCEINTDAAVALAVRLVYTGLNGAIHVSVL